MRKAGHQLLFYLRDLGLPPILKVVNGYSQDVLGDCQGATFLKLDVRGALYLYLG